MFAHLFCRTLLALFVSILCSRPIYAGVVFLGPTPYLSAADSPFDLSGLGTSFWLEDFEDGALNTPGVWVPELENHLGSILRPEQGADSVDADDGVIDGFGRGYALRNFNEICSGLGCYGSIYFEFDAAVLGRYPNYVGVVATDVFIPDSRVALAAYDANGTELGGIVAEPFGDFGTSGTTSEDRFLGVYSEHGIATVLVFDFPGGRIEFDHLQYGFAVPEPRSIALMLVGAAASHGVWKRFGNASRACFLDSRFAAR